MEKGSAFLMGSPGGATKHLWIVISDKNKHNGTSVIVNLTSNKVRSGDDCPMSSTDHPWIKKDCWVCFQDALCVSAVQWNLINNAIASKKIIPQVKTGDKTIERIVLEAKKSSALPKICLPYLD